MQSWAPAPSRASNEAWHKKNSGEDWFSARDHPLTHGQRSGTLQPMKTRKLLLPSFVGALSLLIAGCPTPSTDDDDSAPNIPDVPEVVNTEWIGDLTGTITYVKTYTSGDLEGTDCTEVFSVDGSPITAPPQDCVACDLVQQVFLTNVEDCPGGDDLEDEGQAGFDLRQVEQEAVMWWFQEGWFNNEWTELGTGGLSQDFDASVLDFIYEFDDPNNGSFISNNHWDVQNGCTPCSYDGSYTMDLGFSFVLPDDWYEQQNAE